MNHGRPTRNRGFDWLWSNVSCKCTCPAALDECTKKGGPKFPSPSPKGIHKEVWSKMNNSPNRFLNEWLSHWTYEHRLGASTFPNRGSPWNRLWLMVPLTNPKLLGKRVTPVTPVAVLKNHGFWADSPLANQGKKYILAQRSSAWKCEQEEHSSAQKRLCYFFLKKDVPIYI